VIKGFKPTNHPSFSPSAIKKFAEGEVREFGYREAVADETHPDIKQYMLDNRDNLIKKFRE
jgi:hypothetical protein